MHFQRSRKHGPGRYDADKHSLDPLRASNVWARSSNKMIHHKDGQVVLDPLPWQAGPTNRTTKKPVAPACRSA